MKAAYPEDTKEEIAKAIGTGIILSIVDIKKNIFFEKRSMIKQQLPNEDPGERNIGFPNSPNQMRNSYSPIAPPLGSLRIKKCFL